MLEVIEPDRGWETLRSLYNHHKLAGKPKRDKLGTMVAAADLFALGIRLMEGVEKSEIEGIISLLNSATA